MGNQEQGPVHGATHEEGDPAHSRRRGIFKDSHTPSKNEPSHHQQSQQQISDARSHHSRSNVGSRGHVPPSYNRQSQGRYEATPIEYKSQSKKSSIHPSQNYKSHTPVRQMDNFSQDQTFNSNQIPPAERFPTKISYFNAWSLPIQKYYLEERGPYQPEEEQQLPVQAQERRQMREFNASALEEIMAQRMKEELVTTQKNKRRQNLNMV